MSADPIGTRMKEFYEDRTKVKLPRRTYTVVRADGKAFSTYTRGMEKPFDTGFIEDMNQAAVELCKEAQGAIIGYVFSDEISVVLADFQTLTTDAWFDGNVQKIVSVSASTVTAEFNSARINRVFGNGKKPVEDLDKFPRAKFDARAWTIPRVEEVKNYCQWRQQDSTRNSIQSVAQSTFSSKELHSKSTNEMQDMIFQKSGKNWNDYPVGQKRGRTIVKRQFEESVLFNGVEQTCTRTRWVVEDPPIFSQERDYLNSIFKSIEENVQE